jgi:hypothetical protein
VASDLALIAVAAITGLGTGVSTNIALLQTRRQEAARDERNRREARRYRNHDQRVRTAAEYLMAFDEFRRAVKEHPDPRADPDSIARALERQDSKARALADVAGLMEMYFEKPVIAVMREAERDLVGRHRQNRGLRPEAPDEPVMAARRRVIEAMNRQLESADG